MEQMTDSSRTFYEGAILLSLIGPLEEVRTFGPSPNPNIKIVRTAWHDFIDGLSWLGDHKRGGKTVTSVAAEGSSRGTRFWVACVPRPQSKSLKHLDWILQELQKLVRKTDEDLENVRRRIFKASVQFSFLKVQNYSRRLQKHIETSQILLQTRARTSDAALPKYLSDLVGAQSDHERLCLLAYEFRNSPASRILADKIQNRSFSALWLLIRHYIGRLGSWWKACKALTDGAMKFPSRFEKFTVSPVISPEVSLSLPEVSEVVFQDALKRLFPSHSDGQLQRLLQSLRHRSGSDIDEKFVEKFTHQNFRPRLHAEVYLTEHFHRHQLNFVGDDRYIGCSKPSCYCCNFYMKFHPGSYQPRPCHGNVWINWCTPAHLDMQIALSRNESDKIMRLMIEQMRQDILFLATKPHAGSLMFDSATEFSTSVAVSLM